MPKKKQLSFEELKDHWYKKLAKSGFVDIEKNEDYLHEWHGHRFKGVPKEVREAKVRYYTLAEHFLNEFPFRTEVDKVIWSYHAEGIAVRDIARLLRKAKVKSVKTNKTNVWMIIKKLRSSMYAFYSSEDLEYYDNRD